MLERIISGGQTGADRAALDAAIACGFPHGGWCPRGRLAEDGPIPERYELIETGGASYLARTERNVKRSDGTVILTIGGMASGSARTADFARRHRKPWCHLRLDETADAEAVARLQDFIREHEIRTLNVAGSRASTEPELYSRCRAIIGEVLR
jgi:hypothetical protein